MRELIIAIRAAFYYLFLFGFWFTPISVNAQDWNWVEIIGSSKTETPEGLLFQNNGQILLAGTFEHELLLGDTNLISTGEKDIFLASFNTDMTTLWARGGGGLSDEKLADIGQDHNNNIICAGSYWLEATFGGDTIQTENNPKGLFLLKINSLGQEIWLRKIDGADLKAVEDIKVDQVGNIYLCGYFDQQLQGEGFSLDAAGETDLFLIKYNPEGEVIYASHVGYSGDTRAISVALASSGKIVLGGYYNDTTIIAQDTLIANTTDRDVFIACFDQEGNAIWGRKAGGVHDDELTGIAIDPSDHIYATGYLVGVMNLGNGISIQSSNGNSDFYLLKYNMDGQPLEARALGGSLIQQTTDIEFNENQLLIAGFYQGEMDLDGLTVSAGNSISSFVAGFDLDLNTKWVKSINGSGNVFIHRISANEAESVLVTESFEETILFNDTPFSSAGEFDIFLGQLNKSVTPTVNLEQAPTLLSLFPNPTANSLNIKTNLTNYNLLIYSIDGQLFWTGKNEKNININHLPKGTYSLQLQSGATTISRIFIKK